MGARGQKSQAEVAVISSGGIATTRRPPPPADLTTEQAEEWTAVVNRLPADWFPRETHGMLSAYCRHLIAARRVAEMLDQLETAVRTAAEGADDKASVILSSAEAMDRLLKMQDREGRAISSLATRMRLSQQATYDRSKKKPTGITGSKLWERS